MDKCKYFLKHNGTTLMFTSDAELTQFIKDNQPSNIHVTEAMPLLFQNNPAFAQDKL